VLRIMVRLRVRRCRYDVDIMQVRSSSACLRDTFFYCMLLLHNMAVCPVIITESAELSLLLS